MLRRAYAEWLLRKLEAEQHFASSIFYNELKKAYSLDDYYEAKRKLGLNMNLGRWIFSKITKAMEDD
ncbi:hypothetical protein J7M02_03990 [Candidatus Aerophobetes bacterium]|nr:hypothetical protein [Candidatus Aerophobetes bacterium]